MKTRIGFVSNSSTTSFAIYGYFLDLDGAGLESAKQKLLALVPPEDRENYKADPDADEYENAEILEGLVSDVLDTYQAHNYNDNMFIGQSFLDMKDDETKKEFTNRISEKIKSIFGSDAECKYYEKAWRDG